MKIKKRTKSYVKHSKNGTIYHIKFKHGHEYCDPSDFLFVKYNQYLFDIDGKWMRISQMNQSGYEFDVYLYDDLKKNGYVDEYLENQIIDTYLHLIGRRM